MTASHQRIDLESLPVTARTTGLWWPVVVILVALTPVLEGQLTRVTPREGLRIQMQAAVGPLEPIELIAPPQIAGAREIVSGRLRPGSKPEANAIEITSAYFASQSEGREMIAWSNNAAPDRGRYRWSVVNAKTLDPQQAGLSHGVQERVLANGQERRLMWSWYEIGGRQASSDLGGKLLTAWALARGQGDHSCWHVISLAINAAGASPEQATDVVDARRNLADVGKKLPCL